MIMKDHACTHMQSCKILKIQAFSRGIMQDLKDFLLGISLILALYHVSKDDYYIVGGIRPARIANLIYLPLDEK